MTTEEDKEGPGTKSGVVQTFFNSVLYSFSRCPGGQRTLTGSADIIGVGSMCIHTHTHTHTHTQNAIGKQQHTCMQCGGKNKKACHTPARHTPAHHTPAHHTPARTWMLHSYCGNSRLATSPLPSASSRDSAIFFWRASSTTHPFLLDLRAHELMRCRQTGQWRLPVATHCSKHALHTS